VSAVAPAPAPVPFLDLRAPYEELRAEIDAAVARTLGSGWYLLGDELAAFERQFAAYVGTPHALGLANGLDALHLGLRALGVGPGDEVIVPSNTYIATWLAVSMAGARPIPVEPDPRTYNLDPAGVEAAVTGRTRAVLPVHLYGQPADMDPIVAVAARHSLRVLEDAAQAHGARYKARHAGALGDAAAWSFYPGKNLGAFGDAGGLTTAHADVADRTRVLRNYGSRVKYVNEVQGVNSRLDDLQAAVLAVKLRHLDVWNARRARQAARYDAALAATPLMLPYVPTWAEPAWHLYVVRVPGGPSERDRVQRLLADAGVGTIIHYPIPPHRQAAYADLGFAPDAFPLAAALADEVLSLPIGPHLSDAQQDRVVEVLTKAGAF
jgi:dTDP-4-amino-4,6-dideoxygalactose transaminase